VMKELLKRRAALCVLTVTGGTAAVGQPTILPPSPNAEAHELEVMGLLQRLGVTGNLTQLAHAASLNTVTVRGVMGRIGPEPTLGLLREEIARIAPKYQERWDRNLARAHLMHLNVVELRSFSLGLARSPYREKYLAAQDPIGGDMQRLSSSLLTDMVGEVIRAIFERAFPDPGRR